MRLNLENLFLVLLVSLGMTGCMSFRGGEGVQAGTWPPQAPSVKPSLRIATSAPSIGEGEENMGRLISEAALRAYQDSGAFSSVTDGYGGQPDIVAEVTLTHRGEFNALMAQLTGWTLCMIPMSASDYYTVTTTWKNRDGQVIGQTEYTEEIEFWIQFFLVFGMPFADDDVEVMSQVFYDLNRQSIGQLVPGLSKVSQLGH